MKITLAVGCAAVLLPSANAQNFILNGGFETGGLTGWGQVASDHAEGVSTGQNLPAGVFAGTYSAFFGQNLSSGPGGIGQTFASTPGQAYIVSFELSNGGGGPVSFEATWNGTAKISSTTVGSFPWTYMTFTDTATSASTTLQFVFLQHPDYYGLDNVSVTLVAVPEPATCAVVSGLALLGFACWSRRR